MLSFPHFSDVGDPASITSWSHLERRLWSRSRNRDSPLQSHRLDKELDVGVGGEVEEGCGTGNVGPFDEVVGGDAHNAEGGGTGEEFDVELFGHIEEFGDGG